MATAKELKELSADDLNRRAAELRETLFQDQLKRATGSLDNPSERTQHKRDLARILTVLGEKSRAEKKA
ncbi:50S ribosomal protein L29 [Archangium gephyra]|jgi:large subunit ribosomal protein L29|uniref:Large ribosomal subunit protein uL29 n=1 Tax=Archangium gephyra TaxID=48 RepID=A0AAC8Q925_9BACT|nr:50S ribosomal protein L29 [Archangium gephyra]AKJ03110.1 LSU ribosomal protein L29p [Archangium gephyra]REG23010.1 large subunit ribosomal protein L29 [Archangium gephyra]HZH14344.1 50S ribosomal protein L29 [Archangium sp.]